MCLDLVARHFSLCSPQTIVHSEIPKRFTDGNGVTWLFLSKSEPGLTNQATGARELLELHLSSAKWRINTYEKSMLTQSPIGPLITRGGATFNQLYTMSLDPLKVPPQSPLRGPNNWNIMDGKDWFLTSYPQKTNLVAHEQLWTAVHSSGEVGGFISSLFDAAPGDNRDRVYVSDLFIQPQFRRQGLAKWLLRHVVNGAREGVGSKDNSYPPIVCLTVFCENFEAVGAYFKEGFRVDDNLWVIDSL